VSASPRPPLCLTYTLTPRQRWRSHFGLWGLYWKPLLGIHAVVAGVVALAWWSSWWFLLILAVPILPPIDNFWRWVVGIVAPLFGGRRIEAIIDVEGERVGANFRGHGLEYLAYHDIRCIHRIGDLWCLLFDRSGLEIPAALIDPGIIQHMKEKLAPD
jgi:hypothetical protein